MAEIFVNDFEAGVASWVGDANSVISSSTEQAFDGTKSAKIAGTGLVNDIGVWMGSSAPGNPATNAGYFPVVAGSNLGFDLRYYVVPDGTAAILLWAHFVNDAGATVLTTAWGSISPLVTSAWDKFSGPGVIVPAGATYATIALTLYSGGQSDAITYFDDLRIYEVNVAVPTSDVSNPGGWINQAAASANLFQSVDEGYPPVNTDYIDSTQGGTGDAITFALSAVADPLQPGRHMIALQAQRTDGFGLPNLTVELLQGTTVIATRTSMFILGSALVSWILSDAEANAITDYGNLRLRVTKGFPTPEVTTNVRFSPDVLRSVSGLTNGFLARVQDDPDSPDGLWATATTNNTSGWMHVGFPTPEPPGLDAGNVQEFRVLVRKQGGTGTPTCRLDIYVNNVLSSAGTNVNVTNATGQIISRTWDPAAVWNSDPYHIEVRVVFTASGGTTAQRASVDIGAIEFNAKTSNQGNGLGRIRLFTALFSVPLPLPPEGGIRKIKQGGAIVTGTRKFKQGGAIVTKPRYRKVGGVLVDA